MSASHRRSSGIRCSISVRVKRHAQGDQCSTCNPGITVLALVCRIRLSVDIHTVDDRRHTFGVRIYPAYKEDVSEHMAEAIISTVAVSK